MNLVDLGGVARAYYLFGTRLTILQVVVKGTPDEPSSRPGPCAGGDSRGWYLAASRQLASQVGWDVSGRV
jgi:hypothetical protein